MHLAVRLAAAILSVPPDVLAPYVPMMAPAPRNALESALRNEVDSTMSGPCCRSPGNSAPLFAISREEVNYVNCDSGLPSTDMGLYMIENSELLIPEPSTYGEITLLGTIDSSLFSFIVTLVFFQIMYFDVYPNIFINKRLKGLGNCSITWV
jgi:hypothetical protein